MAELFRITRMARIFEDVRTIDTEELSRGGAFFNKNGGGASLFDGITEELRCNLMDV